MQGINNVERAYDRKYGPGSYKPIVPVTYWSFRLMIGFGSLAALLALAGLWLSRRRRIPHGKWFYRAAIWGVTLPYLASTMGWIFTEMGRQPWTVFGVLQTSQSQSPGVTASSVIISVTRVHPALRGARRDRRVADDPPRPGLARRRPRPRPTPASRWPPSRTEPGGLSS